MHEGNILGRLAIHTCSWSWPSLLSMRVTGILYSNSSGSSGKMATVILMRVASSAYRRWEGHNRGIAHLEALKGCTLLSHIVPEAESPETAETMTQMERCCQRALKCKRRCTVCGLARHATCPTLVLEENVLLHSHGGHLIDHGCHLESPGGPLSGVLCHLYFRLCLLYLIFSLLNGARDGACHFSSIHRQQLGPSEAETMSSLQNAESALSKSPRFNQTLWSTYTVSPQNAIPPFAL